MEAFFTSLLADFLLVPLAIFFGALVEAAFMEGEVLERGIIIVNYSIIKIAVLLAINDFRIKCS